MPLYEYLCSICENRFEVLQRLGEGADGLSCPECAAERVERQFSTFASSGGDEAGPAAPACAPGAFT